MLKYLTLLNIMFWWFIIILSMCWTIDAENIYTSRVFVIPIGPETFHLKPQAKRTDFSYQASLINAPDLPPWIHYTYSNRHNLGFIYGVAPKDQRDFQLEIVALNKRTYETSYTVLNMSVVQKDNTSTYEVLLKIDNLNIEDTFDGYRLQDLMDLFRTELWKESQDLYVSYLISAVAEGARLPLDPREPEGVVLRLGSSIPFSQTLIDFEKELEPLRKRSPCPKDFKKTSKEKLFREARFLMDWCSFQLITSEITNVESALQDVNNIENVDSLVDKWQWSIPKKSDIPTRNYTNDILTWIFIPISLLIILAILLSIIICLHHEKVLKREQLPVENFGKDQVQMVQYATSERGTLRSLAVQPVILSETLEQNPGTSRNSYLRPNPPPYTAPGTFGTVKADL
ncbi:alpha-sarcoglycan isoform X1 [Aphidius gifuensis]|uniref:alpha-sarcoglycan isoform X1 n=1 Tax=Aphidius gifuensis TaxID=684658 RepID=UPI001CDB6BFD|nr:alpha-sarcoglycan isoform X1 [Aphidius gifuensis]